MSKSKLKFDNVISSRESLEITMNQLYNQEIDYKTAAVYKSTVGILISGAKTQVDYQKMKGTKHDVTFLHEPGWPDSNEDELIPIKN